MREKGREGEEWRGGRKRRERGRARETVGGKEKDHRMEEAERARTMEGGKEVGREEERKVER